MFPVNYHEWMKQLVAESQEKKYEYYIMRAKADTRYFYHDYDVWEDEDGRDTYQLIWTKVQRLALPFETEQEVEEFKSDFISPRKASIIRVHRQPHSIYELMD